MWKLILLIHLDVLNCIIDHFVIVLLTMFYRKFICSHVSILDLIYKQHTINKSIYFCS